MFGILFCTYSIRCLRQPHTRRALSLRVQNLLLPLPARLPQEAKEGLVGLVELVGLEVPGVPGVPEVPGVLEVLLALGAAQRQQLQERETASEARPPWRLDLLLL